MILYNVIPRIFWFINIAKNKGNVTKNGTAIMRYKNVFFDLDGTLLPMDLDEFIQKYFEYIVEAVNELEAIHKLRTAENATGEVHEITELKPNNGIIFVRCHHT